MKNKRAYIYRTIMLVFVVALITFIITSTYIYNKFGSSVYTENVGVNSELIKKIYAVKTIIDNKYVSDINESNLINSAIKGYVNGLGDEYTEYFTKEEMDDFKTDTEGNYVGIGIYMLKNTTDNTIVVLSTIEGSPAEQAGILTGDIIRKVDNVEYTGEEFDTISSNIKGKEGTKVKLEIERKGEILTFEVERKSIDLYPIKTEILEKNIGYINITSFDNNASEEFKEKYNELKKNNINSLIIDLRDNGGGIVREALKIADYIVDKGDITLITKDKDGKEEIDKNNSKPIINIPVVVLVNENTASASEILAAALKDNGKATIIGEKTYGKGVIQELISLSDGSGIKITIEEYFTPNRNKINKIGITPDKEVVLSDDVNTYNLERSKDTQLQEAVNTLIK